MLPLIVRESIVVYLTWENLEMSKDSILHSETILAKEAWVIIWNETLFTEISIKQLYIVVPKIVLDGDYTSFTDKITIIW